MLLLTELLHVKEGYRMLEKISIYTYIEANCDDKRPISRQQNLLLYAIFRTNWRSQITSVFIKFSMFKPIGTLWDL